MTVKLNLARNWWQCPESWRNFASDIHTRGGFLPESEFWLTVRQRLHDDFNARIVGDPYDTKNKDMDTGYIEFTNNDDLTMFLLRWL